MDEHFHVLRGNKAERHDGRFRRGDVIVPIGKSEGEILTEIADGGHAGH